MSTEKCPVSANCDFESTEFELCTWLNDEEKQKYNKKQLSPSAAAPISGLPNGTIVTLRLKGNNKYVIILLYLTK